MAMLTANKVGVKRGFFPSSLFIRLRLELSPFIPFPRHPPYSCTPAGCRSRVLVAAHGVLFVALRTQPRKPPKHPQGPGDEQCSADNAHLDGAWALRHGESDREPQRVDAKQDWVRTCVENAFTSDALSVLFVSEAS